MKKLTEGNQNLDDVALLKRIFFLSSVAIIFILSVAFLFSAAKLRQETEGKAQLLLAAMEAGPVNFSRLHSPSIAIMQIESLFKIANSADSIFLSAEVHSGFEFSDRVLKYEIPAAEVLPSEGCISEVSKDVIFKDALYPYRTKVRFNSCGRFSENWRTYFAFFLIALLVSLLTISAVMIAFQPVKRSIDISKEILRIQDDASVLRNVPYAPIASLISAYLESLVIKRDAAIARTAQMLAHDVRKPFNLFRMTIERVKSAKNPEHMSAILNEALPEVDRSLASVNGLISDVLNVGGESTLTLKPTRLASVVEEVVDELRKQYPGRALNIKLDVPPEIWVQADITRLPRVFMNIMSNAIEAVGTQNVKLWLNARTLASGDVEILVGNEGSFIAAESRERIFDLFYTSGKTGGTGLGLAIVKKIVTQHGGSAVCMSEKNDTFPFGKVEFKLTVKSASPIEEKTASASTTFEAVQNESSNIEDSKNEEPTATVQDEKPLVVFLDDSPLVRWVWEAKLKTHVNINCFDGPNSFFQALKSEPSQETSQQTSQMTLGKIHTIITDHYFAPDARMTGIELAAELRRMGFTGRILLASNGEFSHKELQGIVDKVVDKQPVGWENLKV